MENTVAGSPTNQSVDEGVWAWLEERLCRAEVYSPSVTRDGVRRGCDFLPRGDVIVTRCKRL